MKTAAVLILAIAAQAAGNVYLSRGMREITAGVSLNADLLGAVSQLSGVAAAVARSPAVWAGTLLLIAFFLLYAAALSWADLSFVLPATAFGYVINVAAGYYLLNEKVTPARWAGSLIIILGVMLVSKSGARPAGTG